MCSDDEIEKFIIFPYLYLVFGLVLVQQLLLFCANSPNEGCVRRLLVMVLQERAPWNDLCGAAGRHGMVGRVRCAVGGVAVNADRGMVEGFKEVVQKRSCLSLLAGELFFNPGNACAAAGSAFKEDFLKSGIQYRFIIFRELIILILIPLLEYVFV